MFDILNEEVSDIEEDDQHVEEQVNDNVAEDNQDYTRVQPCKALSHGCAMY